jgi:hypothetical protein
MALNMTPYSTQAVFNKSLRFFNTTGDHVDAWVAYEDLINCLDLQDWASRISVGTPPGIICGALPGSIFSSDPGIATPMQVVVAGVGLLNCITTVVATGMAANSPRTGPAQQAVQAAVLAAITTGAAALP